MEPGESARAAAEGDPADKYGEEYYDVHCSRGVAPPYRRGELHWHRFFGRVADNVVSTLAPQTVYDAGCAIGFMVEALWDRGVEAHGRDISSFAIDQVRPDVRRYCTVGSITEPVEGVYDLVLCIEVLEHLAPDDAVLAIGRLVAVTDQVLFSSTSTDFDEPTHINVRPPIYWIRQFASHGFAPVLDYDATYVCPHALLFARADGPIEDHVLTAAAELVRSRTDPTDDAVQQQAPGPQPGPARRMTDRMPRRLLRSLEARWLRPRADHRSEADHLQEVAPPPAHEP